jgi:hypothetical protein
VYFFSLAVGLLFPVPVDFGVMEASGTCGFLAYGVQEFAAVSAMLLNRVLSLASSLVIALIGVIFLHDELRRALHERPRRRPPRPPQAPAASPHASRTHVVGRAQKDCGGPPADARPALRSQCVAVVRFTKGVSYERPSARS